MSGHVAAVLTMDVFRQAEEFLACVDGDWARHVQAIGTCRHEGKPAREPYEALARAIAYQQLHAKAGDAILSRFLALYPGQAFPDAARLLATAAAQQLACGFSAAKLATIRGIAQAAIDGTVPDRATALMLPNADLIERLTTLRGVGRWRCC